MMNNKDEIDQEFLRTSLFSIPELKNNRVTQIKKRLQYIHSLMKEMPNPFENESCVLIVVEKKPEKWLMLKKNKYTMGRIPEADICLIDNKVSRLHCHMENKNSSWVLIDNDSSNGIFVNGEKVKQRILCDGDLIQVGTFDLVFVQPTNVAM